MHGFAQLWNAIPEELKTTKQKIIHTIVMEILFVKKKMIRITESAENVYNVTRQNLHFANAPYNKKN